MYAIKKLIINKTFYLNTNCQGIYKFTVFKKQSYDIMTMLNWCC